MSHVLLDEACNMPCSTTFPFKKPSCCFTNCNCSVLLLLLPLSMLLPRMCCGAFLASACCTKHCLQEGMTHTAWNSTPNQLGPCSCQLVSIAPHVWHVQIGLCALLYSIHCYGICDPPFAIPFATPMMLTHHQQQEETLSLCHCCCLPGC